MTRETENRTGYVERDWPVEGAELITLVGDLDVPATLELRRALFEALGEAEELVVDLTPLTVVDASVLGMLADTARVRRADGRRLAVIVAEESVAKLLHITALDQVLDVCGSRTDVFRAHVVAA
ncbi:MAG: STAS domain-containing protein [Actinobacteria bacterium]|nr:STAS domain-containing protein [Actinomycetota bacterium]